MASRYCSIPGYLEIPRDALQCGQKYRHVFRLNSSRYVVGMGIGKKLHDTVHITIHGSRYDYIIIHCSTMYVVVYSSLEM